MHFVQYEARKVYFYRFDSYTRIPQQTAGQNLHQGETVGTRTVFLCVIPRLQLPIQLL